MIHNIVFILFLLYAWEGVIGFKKGRSESMGVRFRVCRLSGLCFRLWVRFGGFRGLLGGLSLWLLWSFWGGFSGRIGFSRKEDCLSLLPFLGASEKSILKVLPLLPLR